MRTGRPRVKVSVGETYNRLTYIEDYIPIVNNGGHYIGKWRCVCGKEMIFINSKVKSGHTKSCGCLQKEKIRTLRFKHGYAKKRKESVEYKTWQRIKDRCLNPKNKDFRHYGERGIIICDRWKESFENFLEDVGERPGEKYSIDRINPNGNYEKNNCRWILNIEQSANRRTNVKVLYKNHTYCLFQYCKLLNLKYTSILYYFRKYNKLPENIILITDGRTK
jgi:hypothetical protein